MNAFKTRVISDPAEFEALSDNWEKILSGSEGSNSLFLTHTWISTFYRRFDRDTSLNIVVVEKEGELVGIFPLKKVQCRLGMVRLKVLENIGTSNSNPVGFFKGEDKEQITGAFTEYLIREVNDGFTVRFVPVPEDSPFINLFKQKIPHMSGDLACFINILTVAPYIRLKNGWDEYFRSLSKNRRKRLRKILNYANNGHTVEFGKFNADTIAEGLSKLFELHIKRWKSLNMESPFLYPEACNFYRDIAASLEAKGWLDFTFLRIDGEILSLIFAVIYDGKVYSATIARDRDYEKLNLGHLHHYFMIKEAFEKGLKEYDFLRGDELHKFHWTQQWRKYERVIIARKSPLGRIDILCRAAILRLIEIKQNRHSPRELIGLILYQLKNRRLVKDILQRGRRENDLSE